MSRGPLAGGLGSLPNADRTWEWVLKGLDQNPQEGLNTYREACGRWATDRGKVALIIRHEDGGREVWTYHDLARICERAAAMFSSLGLKTGDRVAAIVSRQVEAWIVALAAWRSGIVYVPLFSGFGADGLAMRMESAAIDVVVVGHEWRDSLDTALALLPKEPAVVTIAGPKGKGLRKGDWSFWGEIERARPMADVAATASTDAATLMFTSGTTSKPKSCIIPHSGFLPMVPFVRHSFALTPGDLLFATSDPGWSYGLYTTGCTPMSMGLCRVIYTGDFNPKAWLRVIDEEAVSFMTGAPTAFRRLLQHIRRTGAIHSLNGAATAGEALDVQTVRDWEKYSGVEVRDGYGLTEVAMALANMGNPKLPINPGWLSAPVPGIEVRLQSQKGDAVEDGEPGTLAIRRPPYQLSIGYENAPEAWESRWHGDWYVTDDMFQRNERGEFRFCGRADDIIVTSGYNVGPVEVESVLLDHPDVLDAAAVSAPDADRGFIVRAVVVAAVDADKTQLTASLQQAVRDRIGRHAYPRQVDYIDSLPRTETGKLRRAALREESSSSDAATQLQT